MPFHRKTLPPYGPLPAGHDYINNAVSGTPAPASAQQSGGTYDGTYYSVPAEAALAENFNRPADALAENCDYLDNVVNSSVPKVTTLSGVAAGVTASLPITGDVFVGKPGTGVSQAELNQLCVVTDPDGNQLTDGTGTPILVTSIESSGGGSVVGNEANGFHTDPEVHFTPSIPDTSSYVLHYGVRSTLQARTDTTADLGANEGRLIAVSARPVSGGLVYTPNGAWRDGANLGANLAAVTTQAAIDDIVDTLGSDSGPAKVGAPDFAPDAVSSFPARSNSTLQDVLDALEGRAGHLVEDNRWRGAQQFDAVVSYATTANRGSRVLRLYPTNVPVEYDPSAAVRDQIWLDLSGLTVNGTLVLGTSPSLQDGETVRLVVLDQDPSYTFTVETVGTGNLYTFTAPSQVRPFADFSWDSAGGDWILTAHNLITSP